MCDSSLRQWKPSRTCPSPFLVKKIWQSSTPPYTRTFQSRRACVPTRIARRAGSPTSWTPYAGQWTMFNYQRKRRGEGGQWKTGVSWENWEGWQVWRGHRQVESWVIYFLIVIFIWFHIISENLPQWGVQEKCWEDGNSAKSVKAVYAVYAVLFAVLLLELANEKYHVRCFFIQKKQPSTWKHIFLEFWCGSGWCIRARPGLMG